MALRKIDDRRFPLSLDDKRGLGFLVRDTQRKAMPDDDDGIYRAEIECDGERYTFNRQFLAERFGDGRWQMSVGVTRTGQDQEFMLVVVQQGSTCFDELWVDTGADLDLVRRLTDWWAKAAQAELDRIAAEKKEVRSQAGRTAAETRKFLKGKTIVQPTPVIRFPLQPWE
ncbi:hypothetical protein [Azospirillum sp. sgz301742]